MFLTSFNNMFTFFMVASVPIPALRSFSLQVCADRIKETNVVSNDSCHSCHYQAIGFVSENKQGKFSCGIFCGVFKLSRALLFVKDLVCTRKFTKHFLCTKMDI